MKRPPRFNIIRAAADRQWVRLVGGNGQTVSTTETFTRPRTAQRAVTLARLAVAVELAEALREAPQWSLGISVDHLTLRAVASVLPTLAENLPAVEVREVGK